MSEKDELENVKRTARLKDVPAHLLDRAGNASEALAILVGWLQGEASMQQPQVNTNANVKAYKREFKFIVWALAQNLNIADKTLLRKARNAILKGTLGSALQDKIRKLEDTFVAMRRYRRL